MSYVLVIVDMQPGFWTALNGRTQDNIVREVEKAKRDNAWIFVVEYCGYQSTVKKIRHAIGTYDKQLRMTKYDDNGGDIVMSNIYNIFPNDTPEVIMTGVNFGACVKATAIGMVRDGYPSNLIRVVADACNQPEDWEEEDAEQDYSDDDEYNNDYGYDTDFSWNGIIRILEANNICVV